MHKSKKKPASYEWSFIDKYIFFMFIQIWFFHMDTEFGHIFVRKWKSLNHVRFSDPMDWPWNSPG